MLWVTLSSALLSISALISDSSIFAALEFVTRHPQCLVDIILLSLSSTLGQLFILTTIKRFGALLFATVMTTRQFISILLSAFLYFHPITLGQWGGTALVFGSLYYQAYTTPSKAHGNGGSGSEEKDTAAVVPPVDEKAARV